MTHTPTPWEITEWSGGEGHAKGFYVSRSLAGRTEWLKTSDGKAARKFNTREAAAKAIGYERTPQGTT